jgi:hypothetical protein
LKPDNIETGIRATACTTVQVYLSYTRQRRVTKACRAVAAKALTTSYPCPMTGFSPSNRKRADLGRPNAPPLPPPSGEGDSARNGNRPPRDIKRRFSPLDWDRKAGRELLRFTTNDKIGRAVQRSVSFSVKLMVAGGAGDSTCPLYCFGLRPEKQDKAIKRTKREMQNSTTAIGPCRLISTRSPTWGR